MKSKKNKGQSRESRIQRMLVTSRYKNYCRPISVGFGGISDGLVSAFKAGSLHSSNFLGFFLTGIFIFRIR
jgi:hypothetical protein